MGYHIITKNSEKGLVAHYIENLTDIADLEDIARDSIIYQAEPQWAPVRLDTSDIYKKYLEDWYRAGLRAEKLFKELCRENGFIVERLSQDQESYKQYCDNENDSLKRGDYIVRNAGQVEVEVKCLSEYPHEGVPHYFLPYKQIKGHENMTSKTQCAVLLAVFKRKEGSPIAESLSMVSVSRIREENNRRVSYDKDSRCLRIPVDMMEKGLSLLVKSPR